MTKPTGSEIQKAMVEYADVKYPELCKLLVKITNEGKRSFAQGKKMKAEGLRKGFPDFFVFRARDEYHGAAIEIKGRNDTLKPEQREYLDILERQGYYCDVIDSIDQGMEFLDYWLR